MFLNYSPVLISEKDHLFGIGNGQIFIHFFDLSSLKIAFTYRDKKDYLFKNHKSFLRTKIFSLKCYRFGYVFLKHNIFIIEIFQHVLGDILYLVTLLKNLQVLYTFSLLYEFLFAPL